MKMTDGERRLAQENIGLVHAVLRSMGIYKDYDEYFGEGCVGLCKAAMKWSPEEGKFSTFASHLIRHEVINRIGYLHKLKRSGCRHCRIDAVEEWLSVPDERFELTEDALAVREFSARLVELIGEYDALIIRLLASGMSIKETAAKAGCSPASVRRAQTRAKQAYLKWTGI
jgi:RNA polymerase sporulation-specific sigma factor